MSDRAGYVEGGEQRPRLSSPSSATSPDQRQLSSVTGQQTSTRSQRHLQNNDCQEYTTLLSLGAAVPGSPQDTEARRRRRGSNVDGTHDDSLIATLAFVSHLLHPAGGRERRRDQGDSSGEGSTPAMDIPVDERTPLMGPPPRRQQQQHQYQTMSRSSMMSSSMSSSLRRKYVGDNCCDPLEPVATQTQQSPGQAGAGHEEAPLLVSAGLAEVESSYNIGVSLSALSQVCFSFMSLLAARYANVLDETMHNKMRTKASGAAAVINPFSMVAWMSGAVCLACTAALITFKVPGR